MGRPKIGIALSGGGALGYAHIGVLQALQDSGIDIDYVSGTSMGAIIGAGYVTGIDIMDMTRFARSMRAIRFLDLNLNPLGLSAGRNVSRIFKKILPDIQIEDTKIPFKCVAADILTGKEYVWEKGSLLTAIRSSMSVPGIFVPVNHEGMKLVDGGIVNNLPDDIVKGMGADIVLSFDAMGGYKISKPPKTFIRAFLNAFFVMQHQMIKFKKSCSDIVVNMGQCNNKQLSFEQETVKEIIQNGYDKTLEMMPKIKKIIENYSKKYEKVEKTEPVKQSTKKSK